MRSAMNQPPLFTGKFYNNTKKTYGMAEKPKIGVMRSVVQDFLPKNDRVVLEGNQNSNYYKLTYMPENKPAQDFGRAGLGVLFDKMMEAHYSK